MFVWCNTGFTFFYSCKTSFVLIMSWFLRIVEEVLKSAWCLVPWTFSLPKRKKGKRETNLKKGEKAKQKRIKQFGIVRLYACF